MTLTVAEAIRNYPQLRSLLSVNVEALSAAQIFDAVILAASSKKFAGIKFHPNIQKTNPASEKALAIYEAAGKSDLFVLVHGGATPYIRGSQAKLAAPIEIAKVAKNFSSTRFLIAHAGSYFTQFEPFTAPQNVWFDTSGCSEKKIGKALSAWGASKLIFGSDWPYCNQSEALLTVNRSANRFSRISRLSEAKLLESILWDNAQSLIRE